MAPAQVVSEKQPDRVRLTMLDSTRIELAEPQVSGDEILGKWDWDKGWYGAPPAPKRVPIDSVAYAETRKVAVVNTVFLAVLVATGVAFVGLVILCSVEELHPASFCGY
jgi:hypothetical protein